MSQRFAGALIESYRMLRRLRRWALNRIDAPVVVLLYHRVTDLPTDTERLAVSPPNFRDHMRFLKANVHLVRLEENWSARPKPAVAVTFDDGYADNLLEAVPILEEEGVPATFFVSTGTLGTGQEFWWHELEGLLLHEATFPARFALRDPQHGREWPSETLPQRQAMYAALNQLAQGIEPERLARWLAQLRSWAPSRPAAAANRTMSEEEVRRLAASPIATIGAHTVSHTALAALTEAQQRWEILSSAGRLEQITGRRVEVFSYPFGNRRHYNRASIRLCRQAGFVKAASNFPGQVHRWTDPYQLPRQVVRDWSLDVFKRKMASFWV